jgi:hypothetical protein
VQPQLKTNGNSVAAARGSAAAMLNRRNERNRGTCGSARGSAIANTTTLFERLEQTMAKQIALISCTVIMVAIAGVANADKTQTFDTAASAAAGGWVASGSGVDNQVAGFINENLAGGAPGEAQFDVFRGAELSYLDTNLGVIVNGNGGFNMTGKLNYIGNTAIPDLGFHPILGFSSGPSDYIGIMFRGDVDDLLDGLAWGLRFENSGDGIRVNAGGDFSRVMAQNVPRTFSLVFDPTAGSFGTITASVSDAGNPIVHSLSETNRRLLSEAAYNRFGIFHHATGVDLGHGEKLRFDDLTYTGVQSAPVGVPGDYNGNGTVDAADYVLWRNGGPLQNEVDAAGTVNAADYDAWKARFGNISGSGAGLSSAAVPEPTVGSILAVGVFALLARRRSG